MPEWGLAPKAAMVNGGGGDDPYYIDAMMAWQRTNRVAYQSYFNWGDHVIHQGRYPAAGTKYRSLVWQSA